MNKSFIGVLLLFLIFNYISERVLTQRVSNPNIRGRSYRAKNSKNDQAILKVYPSVDLKPKLKQDYSDAGVPPIVSDEGSQDNSYGNTENGNKEFDSEVPQIDDQSNKPEKDGKVLPGESLVSILIFIFESIN